MTHPCPNCRPGWPCPWCQPKATAERDDYYAAHPATLRGHDVPEDLNGLQVSTMRYAAYVRERRMVRLEEVAA